MKRFYIYLGIIVNFSLLSLTSCEERKDLLGYLNSDNEIIISTRLHDLTDTRATQQVQNTQLASGNKVGVFVQVQEDKGSPYLLYPNRMLSADGKGYLDPGDNRLYYPSLGEISIYAYAPYHTNWINFDSQQFAVASDQTNDENYIASDLIYGTPSANPVIKGSTPVVLLLEHRLAKIILNLKKSAHTALDGAKVILHGSKLNTVFNMQNGKIADAEGEVTAIKMACFDSEIDNEPVVDYGCAAVIIPQTLEEGTTLFEIILSDKTILYYDLPERLTFESGKQYTYTVRVNSSDLTLVGEDVEIEDWAVEKKDAVLETPILTK